jgi:fibronectin type 3 domain-containing protein
VNITEIGSLKLFDNGSNGDAVALDGIYELDYTIPPLTEVNDATVTASFTDRAGNRAPQKKLPFIITIANPPQTPELTAIGSGEDQIELSWFIPYLNDFDQYRLYRSETSAVDENSHLVTSITVQNNTTYTDTDLEPGTTYYYRVYIYDRSGLSSASNTVSRKTEDNEVPEAVTVAIEEVDSTNFRLSWTRNDDDDFASYRIYRDTESGVTDEPSKLLAIENSQSSTTYSDQGITVGQTYYYRVYVFDRHGASIGSNEVYAPK